MPTVATITNLTGATTLGAPCNVSLHCTSSTFNAGTWMTARMLWDMGDGTTREGFCVSHVYETPGSYTVTLTVTAQDGTSDSDTLGITVNAYTPGTITYVSGTGSDTTGTGAIGAPYRTLQKACSVQSGTGANKAIYLERGATYTLATIPGDPSRRTVLPTNWSGTAAQPFVIAAYGSGTDPIVYAPDRNSGQTPFTVFSQFQTLDFWRVVGIDFQGPYVWGQPSEFGFGLVFGSSLNRYGMWLRCKFRNWAIGYGAGSAPTNWNYGTTFKDCEFRDNSDTHIYSEWNDGLALLGCTMRRTFASHMMRLPFIQHYYGNGNTWRDGCETRTVMKFHGGQWESSPGVYTIQGCRWVWVDGDTVYPKTESNEVNMSTHNESVKHPIEDGCFQNMRFLTDSTNVAYAQKHCLQTSGRRIAIRNNLVDLNSPGSNGKMIFLRAMGYTYVDAAYNPQDIYVVNNSATIRNTGGANVQTCLLMLGPNSGGGTTGSPIERVHVENNAFHVSGSWVMAGLIAREVSSATADAFSYVTERNNVSNVPVATWGWLSNYSATYALGSTWNALPGDPKGTDSLAATDPGFANVATPDFTITTASAAHSRGRDLPEVRVDRDGRLRLLNASSKSDCGAYHVETSRLPDTVTCFRLLDGTVTLTWTDRCANEDGYRIDRAPDVSGAPGSWATIHTTAADVEGYTDSPGSGYFHYRLRAVRQGSASVAATVAVNTLTWPKSKLAGINPHALDYYNPGMDALKDAMLRAEGPWVSDGVNPWEACEGYASYFRYDAYPKELPPGKFVLVELPTYGPNTWHIFFDGQGTLLAYWTHASGSADSGFITTSGSTFVVPHDQTHFSLSLLSTNANDPVRNVRLVRAADVATYATQPWREDWLALHKHMACVRTLDLMGINDSVMSTLDPHVWVQLKPAPLAERSFGDANTRYAWIAPGGGMGNPAANASVRGETSDVIGVIRAVSRYWETETNWASIVVPSNTEGTAPDRLFVAGEKLLLDDGTYAYVSDPMVCMPHAPALPQFGEREMESPPQPSFYTRNWIGMQRLTTLCNLIDADLWVNIPICASDDMIRAIAQDVANTLDGRRSVYVEIGNENYGNWFAQFAHLEGLRRLRGSASTDLENLREMARAVDLCRQHLTPERVRGVVNGYGYGDPDDIDQWVTQNWNGATLLSRLYAYAIATYYGGTHSYTTVAQIQAASQATAIPNARLAINDWKTRADSRAIRLLAYEGGPHWAGDGTAPVRQATSDYNRTGCYDDLTDYLAEWRAGSGGGLFNFFTDVWRNRDDEDTHWGLGRSVTDTATEKWRAWVDYYTGHFPPSPVGLTATVLSTQNVRLDWSTTGWQADAQTLVERAPSANGPWQVIATVAYPTVTYTDDPLAGDTTYWYRVATDDPRGRSAYTPVVSATTQGADVRITTGPWALVYSITEPATVSVGLSTPIVAQTVQVRSNITAGWVLTVQGGGVVLTPTVVQSKSNIPGGWPVTLSPLPPVTPTMQACRSKVAHGGTWRVLTSGGGVLITTTPTQSKVDHAGTWSLTLGGITLNWTDPLVNYVSTQGATVSLGLLPSTQTINVTRKINAIYRGSFAKDPAQVIWLGQALGFYLGGARVLQGSDEFLGFATGKAGIGDPDVWVAQVGTIEIDVQGVSSPAAVTSPVYAVNDSTFSLAPGGPLIGRVAKHISGRRCSVVFRSFYF